MMTTTTDIELHRLVLAHADLRVTDERRIARLAADIGGEGQRQPVLVVDRGEQFVLIDGYARVAALRRLGRDTVVAIVLPLSERDALLFAWREHTARQRFALEDGWLLRELIEAHGLKQGELAVLIGRSHSFVSRRLALVVQLPESVQDAVRQGRIGPAAAERYLVPLSRGNKDHAERLVANLASVRPTARDIGTLYVAWRAADAPTRERIVDHPTLYLKASEVQEPPGDDPQGDVVRAIESIAGACHHARKTLRAGLRQLPGDGRSAVRRAFEESTLAFAAVTHALAQEGLGAR